MTSHRTHRVRVLTATRVVSLALFACAAMAVLAAMPPRTSVRVVMRGQRFTPARVVATVDDSVTFELESGGPHNVAFDADSLPPGALVPLARNLGTDPRNLYTPYMLLTAGETFVLPLAGLPPGTYPFYCGPHLGGGMRGVLVVQARPGE